MAKLNLLYIYIGNIYLVVNYRLSLTFLTFSLELSSRYLVAKFNLLYTCWKLDSMYMENIQPLFNG